MTAYTVDEATEVSMKVRRIVGSPRRNGNTRIMVEEVPAAAREAGAETDIFLVQGKDKALEELDSLAGLAGCYRTAEKARPGE
jgi:multimeric flavodoxin WrbA